MTTNEIYGSPGYLPSVDDPTDPNFIGPPEAPILQTESKKSVWPWIVIFVLAVIAMYIYSK